MQHVVRRFDAWLRGRLGVFEFNVDPECLLRLQVGETVHPLTLEGHTYHVHTSVLFVHLWNEHLPSIAAAGPDLAWAVRFQRQLVASFRMVAQQMKQDPRLAGVELVGGVTALFYPGDGTAAGPLMAHLGFALLPHANPLGRFGEFWENIYAWAILWAYNPASLKYHRLLSMHRSEIWMTCEAFYRRYG